jgi:hypothetical protein
VADFGRRSLIAATFLISSCAAQSATAEPPSDVCALLPAVEVSKALGKASYSLQKSVAPRPYRNTAEGTDCHYEPQGTGSGLLFRIYIDPSTSAATDLFARLKMFYGPPMPISGIGEEAYFDARHGLHARKGKVRFYFAFDNVGTFSSANEKQLKDLASRVANQL